MFMALRMAVCKQFLSVACWSVVSLIIIGCSANPLFAQKTRLAYVQDCLVSIFENSSLTIQYGFIGDIKDGNGFTAGRAGFTSKTGDMLELLLDYEQIAPNNLLTRYINPLKQVYGTADTASISTLQRDWPLAAMQDPLFRMAQDRVNDRLYRQPAQQVGQDLGLQLPISYAAIYEAGIQHGYGDNYDSITKIIERATKKIGATPKEGVPELIWLNAFLEEREKDLRQPENQDYAPTFIHAVDRVRAIQTILRARNYDLTQSITVTVYGDTFTF
jgi:chitosanase